VKVGDLVIKRYQHGRDKIGFVADVCSKTYRPSIILVFWGNGTQTWNDVDKLEAVKKCP
jgi:hypothetical protein